VNVSSPRVICSPPLSNGARVKNYLGSIPPRAQFACPSLRLTLIAGAGVALGVSCLLLNPIGLDRAPDSSTQVEPETSVAFPHTIQPPSCPPLVLIGLGVRKVSFLRIKVYVVGFYADPTLLEEIPEELPFEEKIDHVIHSSSCAIRIVPVRSTSYTHLRDAFIRALRLRITKSRQIGQISLDEEDALEESLQKLKGVFPIATLEKHSSLVIYSVPQAGLSQRSLILDGLGEVRNNWMAVNFFKTYFTGDGVSPALLKSVRESLSPGV